MYAAASALVRRHVAEAGSNEVIALGPRPLRSLPRSFVYGGSKRRQPRDDSSRVSDRPEYFGSPIFRVRVVAGIGDVRLPWIAGTLEAVRVHPGFDCRIGLMQAVIRARMDRRGHESAGESVFIDARLVRSRLRRVTALDDPYARFDRKHSGGVSL